MALSWDVLVVVFVGTVVYSSVVVSNTVSECTADLTLSTLRFFSFLP